MIDPNCSWDEDKEEEDDEDEDEKGLHDEDENEDKEIKGRCKKWLTPIVVW